MPKATRKHINTFYRFVIYLFISSSFLLANNKLKPIDFSTSSEIQSIDSLNKLAFSYFPSHPSKTRELATGNLAKAKKINYLKGQAKAYNYIAMSYHISSNYESAIFFYEKASDIFLQQNDSLNLAKIYNNIGLLYKDQEYYHLALINNLNALNIVKKLGDINNIFNNYNNIGITYEKLGQYDNAINSYRKAIDILKPIENYPNLYFYALSNIAIIELLKNNYEEAYGQLSQSLTFFKETKNNYGICQAYHYIAQASLKLKSYQEFQTYIDSSNHYANILGDKKTLASNKYYMGLFYFEIEDLDQAYTYLLEALNDSKNIGINEYHILSLEYLTKIDSIHSNYESAYKRLLEHNKVLDNKAKLSLEKRIAEFNVEYQTLEKNLEIDLLKKDNQINIIQLKRNRIQKLFWIILFIISIAILVLIFINRSRTQKTNFLLKEKNTIIERKNKELWEHKLLLEERVLKRTKELETAKNKAEESDKLKTAFLANMSHEIRTPMNGILGFSRLLDDNNLSDEDKHRYFEIISKSSKRLLNTINNLIDISKIESGQVQLHKTKFKLKSLLNELIVFYSGSAKEKNLSIVLNNSQEENYSIYSDYNKLYTILSNMIENAIKFSSKGKIILSYDLNNNDHIFSIKDEGIGIQEERMHAIFNRFEQADISDKQAHQGSGLGLTISKSYATLLGGEINVKSKVNIGSSFYFIFPREEL